MIEFFGPVVPLLPLLFVALAGLALMVVDAFVKTGAELAMGTFVILALGAGLALGLWDVPVTAESAALLGRWAAADKLALFIDVAVCGGAALAALLAGGYLREHGLERGEFYVILIFSTFGAMALGRSNDVLTLFVALETLSLGAYGMVAFRRQSPRAAEGAMKYFLLGSFASAILLYGSALIYGATGHTDFPSIAAAVEAGDADLPLTLVAMALLLVGLAFKVSAVPFHMWTPDAYEGAVTPATTFMAVAVKAAVVGVLIRVFFVAFGDDMLTADAAGWPPAIAGLAAITMIVGNLAAIVQKSVKRMLAYSSIAHAGYILVGVAAAGVTGEGRGWDEGALSSVLYYVLAYTVSNVLAFGSLIWAGSRGKEAVSYEDLAGLGRRHPIVAVPFVLGVLSLMGFPPTAGFFGKYYVLQAAVAAGGGMVWLAVLLVLTSAIGAYYYLRVIVFLFMKQPEPGAPVAVPMRSWYVAAALVLSGYFVLRMGIAPGAYLDLALQAAQNLG
ncbi:NADH-quinone oxidoreductase subunit N [Sandaracinus amylolyticus]|uniref:NADH-quinone oxidoreductase subunit N n=1 Tax=Sandaracinus amylolyticus TaxID=927083 RepID=A0A0F6W2Y6_9BACT|nr:NADH-quinone oxidoreductase subunit N [Sandaracinus amylolyticus]AKF06131.1 NADH-ubiquinone oxidoreductase chain N [Sandaracinus amylolyticus]